MANRPGMKVGENEHNVQGAMLEVGQQAPDFELTTNAWQTRSLADYEGKVKILSVFPSIDTGVCSTQTRRFNEAAASLGDNIMILSISADLPFALRSFCSTEDIENTETLSTHRDMKFADDYGVHDTDWRVCQRSLFVLDANNVVQYAEYKDSIGNEVSFDAALEKAKSLV